MGKLVVASSITVDGFVDAEWFTPYNSDERNAYFRETVFAAGALLLGRKTYDQMASLWPNQKNPMADKMNGLPKYVVSSTPLKTQWEDSTIIKENIVDEIAELKRQTGQNLLVLGSATLADSLAQAGLVDRYQLLMHPVITGSRNRLFKGGAGATKLKLVECKMLSSDLVLLSYETMK